MNCNPDTNLLSNLLFGVGGLVQSGAPKRAHQSIFPNPHWFCMIFDIEILYFLFLFLVNETNNTNKQKMSGSLFGIGMIKIHVKMIMSSIEPINFGSFSYSKPSSSCSSLRFA